MPCEPGGTNWVAFISQTPCSLKQTSSLSPSEVCRDRSKVMFVLPVLFRTVMMVFWPTLLVSERSGISVEAITAVDLEG